MTTPIDPNFHNIYKDHIVEGSYSPQSPHKPFDINATQKSDRTKKDFKKQKKRDKNGKEIDDEEEDDKKPLPRPMGL